MKDSEILEGLYKKHKDLSNELKKVEIAIDAFGGSLFQSPLMTAPAVTPMGYHSTPWRDRIIEALKAIGTSPTSPIADYISEHNKSLNPEKVLTTVNQYCSSMGKAGLLNRTRDGKKYVYSLKSVDNAK